MQDQLSDLPFKRHLVFFRLNRGALQGNGNVAEVSSCTGLFIASRERQDISRFINPPEAAVQILNLLIRNKGDSCIRCPIRIAASACSLKDCQRPGSMRTLRCRLTTSIMNAGLEARLDVALLGVVFVSADDHLHEFMTHHIFFGKVNKLDSFQIREHSFSFNQTAALSGAILLGNVARIHVSIQTDARRTYYLSLVVFVLRSRMMKDQSVDRDESKRATSITRFSKIWSAFIASDQTRLISGRR